MCLKILIFFLLVIAFKAVSNFVKYKRCIFLMEKHKLWCNNKFGNIVQYKGEIIRLFDDANVKDITTPASQPVGHGHFTAIDVSVQVNFPSKLSIVAIPINNMFNEAIGVFKKRTLESFNPLYWLETVLFLPKHLLQYIGLNSENIAFKLCNVLCTFIWWLFGTLLVFFGPQIKQFILSLLS